MENLENFTECCFLKNTFIVLLNLKIWYFNVNFDLIKVKKNVSKLKTQNNKKQETHLTENKNKNYSFGGNTTKVLPLTEAPRGGCEDFPAVVLGVGGGAMMVSRIW